MMKKVCVILMALCFIGSVQADLLVNGVDPANNWIAWANCFNADGSSAGWGSAWAMVDVPATFETEGLTIKPNTSNYIPGDLYWVNEDGTGNKILEQNVYFETSGLAGQHVTFNFNVLSNDLPIGWDNQAFIKVLNPDAGWATVQSVFAGLAAGEGTLDLDVDNLANPVVQIGFLVKGLVVDPTSSEAAASVVIETIPEPATLALLGLGGLLLRRRRHQ